MKLLESKSGKELDATIEKLIKAEIKKLKGNKRFTFDWSLEMEKDVYKIRLLDKKEILVVSQE